MAGDPGAGPVLVVDFGAQYAQLIARRVREAHVYSEIVPHTSTAADLVARRPAGIILSGGPKSVNDTPAPVIDPAIYDAGVPILGICYGAQLLCLQLGGEVSRTGRGEYGRTPLTVTAPSPLFVDWPSLSEVWMSHGDAMTTVPDGFVATASSPDAPVAALHDDRRAIFGVQFHPEVVHTERGRDLLEHFLYDVCGCPPAWTHTSIIESQVEAVRSKVGSSPVLCALSGGVDSAVAAALVHKAVGDQLTCVYVDTGLMRANESEQVEETFRRQFRIDLVHVKAADRFFDALAGVIDPEEKRKIIGGLFIRIFEEVARDLVIERFDPEGPVPEDDPAHDPASGYLVQGTLYPDVIESGSDSAAIIKSHHNVGGLPDDLAFDLVEPLRLLFKDEVRAVGEELGLPPDIVWRQPFPGPGLAVRIVGEVTPERAEILRAADAIVVEEIRRAGLYRDLWQSFAVLPAVRSVGVMGDGRTYAYRAGAPLVAHHQRGRGRQPGGSGHHLQATRDHRVGMTGGGGGPGLLPDGEPAYDDSLFAEDAGDPGDIVAERAWRQEADAQAASARAARAEELLHGLTGPQRAAVVHRGGPLLIVAGAGSGKTRVLTRRIAHLIATGDAAPWQILAITFTNKAADEMRHRVAELVGRRAARMWVSTFHSACVRILRAHGDRLGYKGSFTIYDDADSRRLIEIVCRELEIDTKKLSPRSIQGQISQAKSSRLGPREYRAAALTIFDRRVADVFDLYQQRMVEANAMDFDDLLSNAVRLFHENPDVLEHYRTRFTHILIDEYQDTNAVQNALAVQLAGGHRNIVVVGDSDQSVYRFRGADITNILEFEQEFPDATAITLDQNFRSTQTILDAANAVIVNNVSRKPKTLWTDLGEGERIVRYRAEDEHDEGAWVAHEINRLRGDQGLRWGDVAVFYRTNAQSRALEEAMVRAEVPYRVVGGTKFYDRREIKDVMAYLRVLVNPDDEVNWRRIVNVPKRGVGDTSVARLAGWSGQEGVSFGEAVARADEAGLPAKASAALRGLSGLLDDLRLHMAVPDVVDENGEAVAPGQDDLGDGSGPMAAEGVLLPGELVAAVVERSGYRSELLSEGTIEALGRVENVDELIGVADEYRTLAEFLEAASLVSDADELDGDGSTVSLMTMHIAKGLEFPAVFLVGMEDGVFPHLRSLGDPVELEEERRLCYVGITRAERHLYLSHAWSRMLFGSTSSNIPSRFLNEIPAELLRDVGGDPVRPSFGNGRRYGAEDDDGGTPGRSVFGRGHPGGESGFDATGRRRRPPPSSGAEQLALVPGDRVVHGKWGEGRVVEASAPGEEAEAVVVFDSVGRKKLLLRMAPLKLV